MNRRSFISKSSLAMLAAAGLPKAVLSNPYTYPTTYKTKLEPGIVNQTYYELLIDHNALWDLEKATEDEKKVTLKVAYFETTDFTTPTKGAEFLYIIQECNQTDSVWKIKTKLDKKISGEFKFPKKFPKHITLMGKKNDYFDIIGKKDDVLVHIPYPPPASSGSGGCFLTTACVEHQRLQDDCNELTALRFLRDEYMAKSSDTSPLLDTYKIYGPKIVNAINHCDNKAEIYDYMYQHMIKPAVALVKEERLDDAVDCYKIFVIALAEKYL